MKFFNTTIPCRIGASTNDLNPRRRHGSAPTGVVFRALADNPVAHKWSDRPFQPDSQHADRGNPPARTSVPANREVQAHSAAEIATLRRERWRARWSWMNAFIAAGSDEAGFAGRALLSSAVRRGLPGCRGTGRSSRLFCEVCARCPCDQPRACGRESWIKWSWQSVFCVLRVYWLDRKRGRSISPNRRPVRASAKTVTTP